LPGAPYPTIRFPSRFAAMQNSRSFRLVSFTRSANDARDLAKDLEEAGFDKKNIKVVTDVRTKSTFDKEFDADEARALAEVKKRGMEIVENPDIERFRTAVKPVYDKYADKVGGWKMIQAVLDTK